MACFICPVCSGELTKFDSCYKCAEGHSYDIARQGYVNLLMNNQSSLKHHGDDKLMVLARRRFLEKGYYLPLRDALCAKLREYCRDARAVIDIGCGEGWYTDAAERELSSALVTGIDISREAIKGAAFRNKRLSLAIGSAYNLPVGDNTQDAAVNIFAPLSESEAERVLKSGGMLFRIVPDKLHLFELKECVYDIPRENDELSSEIGGFTLVEESKVDYMMHLSSNRDVLDLFMMTPYYYKTGEKDQHKLSSVNSLSVRAQFKLLVYKKVK